MQNITQSVVLGRGALKAVLLEQMNQVSQYFITKV